MKITAQEFKNLPNKYITLIGMSGAGKSYISSKLEGWGWKNYSCDYEIGSKFLKDELPIDKEFSVDDISILSDYLGKLGSTDKGGFDLDKFKFRQKAYYEAEVASLRNIDIPNNMNFVLDSTGSLCEIEDDNLLDDLGSKTLFVYLKADKEEEEKVLQRARDYPKPLFFPPKFLDENLSIFLSEFNFTNIDDIDPDEFARWVFPKLFDARKPKYQRLADKYGVSILSSEFRNIKSSDDFIEVILRHLDV